MELKHNTPGEDLWKHFIHLSTNTHMLSLLFIWETWDPEWVRNDSGSHSNLGADLISEPRGLRPPRPGYFLRKWLSRVHDSERLFSADCQDTASQGEIHLTALAFDPLKANMHVLRSHFPFLHTFFFCRYAVWPLPMAMLLHKWQPSLSPPWTKPSCHTLPPPNLPQG